MSRSDNITESLVLKFKLGGLGMGGGPGLEVFEERREFEE